MKILAIADEPDTRIWDNPQASTELREADLILSAGDLPASYLSFMTCFSHAPVIYVHGNHDDNYSRNPPDGCICAEDEIIVENGIRILGLGGSMRYRPGSCMYTEEEMAKRIKRLRWTLRKNKGFDILLTHAPIRNIGDQEDLAHRGFECFDPLLQAYTPRLMIHGHIHKSYTSKFVREVQYQSTRVINANGRVLIDESFAKDSSVR